MPETKASPIAGKKILFFSPAFFGYENRIADKMKQLGAETDFFDVRSVTKASERALLKFSPRIFDKKTESYYARILSQVQRTRYDYVLFIKCDMPTERVLHLFRKRFKNAKFCLHLWDSVRNIPDIEKKYKYFDFISSFDRKDCCQNPGLFFRPLYYCDEYRRQGTENSYKYDLCFIGTVHSDRWKILKELKRQADKRGLKTFYYLYLQSRFIYWFYKLMKPEFRDTDIKDFKFNKISSTEASDIIKHSKEVIDIQHPGQSGLTIRTIEMVGMNKKMITTNADVKNYDFYDCHNIQIIKRKKPVLSGDSEKSYRQLDLKVYQKYSLESWIYDVLDIQNT